MRQPDDNLRDAQLHINEGGIWFFTIDVDGLEKLPAPNRATIRIARDGITLDRGVFGELKAGPVSEQFTNSVNESARSVVVFECDQKGPRISYSAALSKGAN